MSNTDNNSSTSNSILKYFKNMIKKEIIIDETVNDIISNNARAVIAALFGLVLFSIILYAFLITGKYNPDSILSGIRTNAFNFTSLENEMYQNILNDPKKNNVEKIAQIQKFNEDRINSFQDRFQQIEQIDAVFMSAITGVIALGGTLITRIWGRNRS